MESEVYSRMYRDIIKTQVQALLDKLSAYGEESVLFTACVTKDQFPPTAIPASEVGRIYVQNHSNVITDFQRFCQKNDVKKASESVNPDLTGKRKQPESNGLHSESSQAEKAVSTPEPKRAKSSFTPDPTTPATTTPKRTKSSLTSESPASATTPNIVKTEPTEAIPAESKPESEQVKSSSSSPLPQGHFRCHICNYSSKFKNNVVRHERTRHGVCSDGAPSPIVEYVCSLCNYRSTYRSNVIRHEKNVHRMATSSLEAECLIPVQENQSDQPQFEILTANQSGHHDNTSASIESIMAATEADNMPKLEESFDQSVMSVGDSNFDSNQNQTNELKVDGVMQTCKYCQVIFTDQEKLNEHIDTFHSQVGALVELKCDKCDQKFDNTLLLHDHLSMHTSTKQEQCACGKMFQYKASLKKHKSNCKVVQGIKKEQACPDD